MTNTRLLLICSASQEKAYKKRFPDLIIHSSENPDETFPYCLPVFHCEDLVITANKMTGKKEKVTQFSFQPRSYSPSRHNRIGTMFGNSYEDINKTIDEMTKNEQGEPNIFNQPLDYSVG